jgi:FkbM family methyltransferase
MGEISLNHSRQQFLAGEISREAYWNSINSSLMELRQIQNLVSEHRLNLEIHGLDLVLGYKIRNDHFMRLLITANDLRTASFTILAHGKYESLLEDLIFELVETSSKFLDIGANMGFYSIGAALTNKSVAVIAFEPNPMIRETLEYNATLNNVGRNITFLEIALSDFQGTETFSVPAFTGSGGGSLRNLHPEEGAPNEFYVKVERLDKFRDQTIGTDLIKIDVEGAEYNLLMGGLATIKENQPTIVIELLRKWMKPFGRAPNDVVKVMFENGYLCFAIGGIHAREITVIDESTPETNFIFCHERRSKHLEVIKRAIKKS